jgi:gas vesicle protein
MHEYGQSIDHDVANGATTMTKFMLGAVVGAGIALLLAPANGRETRSRVGTTVKRWGEGARHVIGKARDRFSDTQEDVKSAISAGRDEYMRSRKSPSSPAI